MFYIYFNSCDSEFDPIIATRHGDCDDAKESAALFPSNRIQWLGKMGASMKSRNRLWIVVLTVAGLFWLVASACAEPAQYSGKSHAEILKPFVDAGFDSHQYPDSSRAVSLNGWVGVNVYGP